MQKCYVCKSNRRQLLMLTCSHDVCIKCAADNYFLNTVGKKEQRKDDKKAKRESYFCEICLQVTKVDEGTVNELKQWYISNVNAKSVNKVNSNSKNGVSGTKEASKQQEKRQRERQKQRRQQQKQRQRRQQQRQRQSNRQRQRQKQRQSNPKHPNNYPSNTYHQNNYRIQNQYQQRVNYQLQQSNHNRNNRQQKSSKQMPQEYQVRGLLRYREEGRQERGDVDMGDYRNTVKRNSNNFNNNKYQQRNGQPQRHSYKPTPHYPSLQYPQPRPTTRSNTTRIFGSILKRNQLKHNQNLKHVITQAKDQQRQRINSYKSEQKVGSCYEPSYRLKKVNTETDQQSEVASRDGVIMRPISKRGREGRSGGNRGMESGYRVEGNSDNRRKQVYLDLIGNEHSLEQQQQQYQTQQQYHQYQQHTPIASTKDYSPSPKPQPINKFSSTQSTYHHTTNTNTNPLTTKSPLTNPTPARKIHCNIHQDQQIIYYCLQCKLLICSQCALYGQHKDHNIHTLKKAAFKLKETLYGLISEINAYLLVEEQREQVLMQQIKEIKIQSNKQKQKVKFAFQNFIKNVQNKYSQILQQLQQSQLKSLSNYNLQLQKCKLKCTQYFERKNSMKNLFQTFAKNPTNNQLAAPYYQSGKNLVASTNVGSNQQKDTANNNNNRVYRQFDDFFEENSMTSEQRNFFNTNIEELQAKISDYEDYVRKIKVEYQRFVYPNAFGQNGLNANNSLSGTKRHSGSKQGNNSNNPTTSKPGTLSNNPLTSFHRPQNKTSRQSLQLHQSLRLSQTSLLIQPSCFQSPLKNNNDQFLCHQDFIQQNNLQSLNLMIEKQLTNSELSQLKENLKLAHVDTIIQSIKQIQEIIKQFSIQYRPYMMKVGKRV